MWSVGILCAVALVTVFVTHWVHKWKNPRISNGVLPPGSMGLPLIGETLELLIPSRSLDLHPFIKKRIQRWEKLLPNEKVASDPLPRPTQGLPIRLYPLQP